MKMYNSIIKYRNFYAFILFFLSILISVFTQNISVLVHTTIFFFLGFLLLKLIDKKKTEALCIYIFFFLIYYVFTFITDCIYVRNYNTDFFYALDSVKYFGLSVYLEKNNANIQRYLFEYRFAPGYGYIVYFICKLSNFIGGTNTVFLHKIHIVFLSSSIISYTYIIGRNLLQNLNPKILFKYILLFGFISHFFTFSAILIRDIHIVFLYTLSFLILTKKNDLTNFLILVLLSFLVFQFRVANGLFSIIFILCFFYKNVLELKSKRKIKIYTVLLALLALIIIGLFNSLIDLSDIDDKATNYEAYHDEMLKNGSGLAKTIYKLPVIVRPFLFTILSQLAPIPAFQVTFLSVTKQYQYLLLPLAGSVIFWIYVDIIILFNFFKKKYRKNIPNLLVVFLIISLLFILVTSATSPEFRRLLPVYPIIFLYFIFIYDKIRLSYKRNVLTLYIMAYAMISIIFIFLK
ncbi:hypothetical protein EU348_16730 [Chryseobacterium indologenes]|uniref:Glycosyltransferase RgtA/B/C/D-like domain-containing protein n=1 Tax=Chryseobacterium indologenes TaxID=253 RepID=A0A411DQX0_CHRID|nr:hypothetical protein EU348_16730 [Chryseobacterium indologenes]